MKDLIEALNRANKLDEDYDHVGTFRVRYVPDDSDWFQECGYSEDEVSTFIKTNSYPEDVYKDTTVDITKSDGGYEVSWGDDLSDYTECSSIEACVDTVNNYGYFLHVVWIDKPKSKRRKTKKDVEIKKSTATQLEPFVIEGQKLVKINNTNKQTAIVIPDGVKVVGTHVFWIGNEYVQSVTIPDSVTTIDDYAFWNCVNLVTVNIPNSVTSIGEGAFGRCLRLRDISIPSNVTSIGERAFENCNSMADDQGFIIVNDVVYGYCGSKEKTVRIPNHVTGISSWALSSYGENLYVFVPNSVTHIASNAFAGNIAIICSKESYAHKYAVENNIPVKLMEALNKAHKLGERIRERSWNASLTEGRAKTVDETNVKTAVCGVLDAAVNAIGKNISYKLLDIALDRKTRPVSWFADVKFIPEGDILFREDTERKPFSYGSRPADNPECSVSLSIPSNVTLNKSSLLDQKSAVIQTITAKYELPETRASRNTETNRILQSAKAIAKKVGLDARWDTSRVRRGELYLHVFYPQEPEIEFVYSSYRKDMMSQDDDGFGITASNGKCSSMSDDDVGSFPGEVPCYQCHESNDVDDILDRFRAYVKHVKDHLPELLSKLHTYEENYAYNKDEKNVDRYIEKVITQANIPGLTGEYYPELNFVMFSSSRLRNRVRMSTAYTRKIDDDINVSAAIKELKWNLLRYI